MGLIITLFIFSSSTSYIPIFLYSRNEKENPIHGNRNENTAFQIQCKLLKFYKLNKTVFFMGNKGCKMC